MTTAALPEKQQKILNFIRAQHARTGVYPSVREIAAHMSFASTNTVDYHLRKLEESGALERGTRRARTFAVRGSGIGTGRRSGGAERARVIEMDEEFRSGGTRGGGGGGQRIDAGVPLLGRVAAGEPILAEQNYDGLVNFKSYFHTDDQTFALKVRGDSMIEAGICDGDLVIVRNQPKVLNGEIAVAIIEDEATVKRFYDEGDHWRLQPENAALSPIMVPKTQAGFRIGGKVVGVIRKI